MSRLRIKNEHESHELTRILFNKNNKNTDVMMVLRT